MRPPSARLLARALRSVADTSAPACAVPVVDAFALSDHIINSPLGRYDGQIYEAYFDQVRRANPLPKGASPR